MSHRLARHYVRKNVCPSSILSVPLPMSSCLSVYGCPFVCLYTSDWRSLIRRSVKCPLVVVSNLICLHFSGHFTEHVFIITMQALICMDILRRGSRSCGGGGAHRERRRREALLGGSGKLN